MASHAEPQTQTTRQLQQTSTRTTRLIRVLVSLAGAAGFLVALTQLLLLESPLVIEHIRVPNATADGIPVTIFRQDTTEPGPPVIIAHGFSGSQQLMHSFAVTIASAGYTAVTFDFPGHGLNISPLEESVAQRSEQLPDVLRQVATDPAIHPNPEEKIALVGHSMGAGTAITYARNHPDEVAAVVAISPYLDQVPAPEVPNLMVMNGALELGLRLSAMEVVDVVTPGLAQADTVYGDFATGTARKVTFVPWVEHIGVLLSSASVGSAVDWIDQGFGRTSDVRVPNRLFWLILLYLSVSALFWPFSLIFRPFTQRAGEPINLGLVNWPWWLALALFPAVMTPIALWAIQQDAIPVITRFMAGWLVQTDPNSSIRAVLPIMVGGPLALFFAVYGLLTASGLLIRRFVLWRKSVPQTTWVRQWFFFPLVSLLAVGYVFLLFGIPTQFFLLNYFPPPARLPIFGIVLVAMLPYFLADEWLTRGPGTPRWAYLITKASFILSLLFAVLLMPNSLFFLILIAPVFIGYFLVHGLFSSWTYRRTGTFLIGAVANAIIFAWIVATIFPLVA